MSAPLCASLATASALWVCRPDAWVIVRTRLSPDLAPSRGAWTPSPAVVAVTVTCVVSALAPSVATQVAMVGAGAAAGFGLFLHRRARRRAAAVAFRSEVARVIRATVAELRAGVDPVVALRAATVEASDAWAPVRSAGGSDIPTALQTAARRPGGEGLADVTAAWLLAAHTGAPLAAVLEGVASTIQAEVELHRDIAVEAGPARATGRLMAILPAFGLGLGAMLGGNPVTVLVGTGLGAGCLVAGLGLACLGVWWIERIVDGLGLS